MLFVVQATDNESRTTNKITIRLTLIFIPDRTQASMPLMIVPLAQIQSPLVQSLIFDALGIDRGPLANLIYSLAIVAMVFLPAVMVFAMFASGGSEKSPGTCRAASGPNRVGPIGLAAIAGRRDQAADEGRPRPAEADWLLFRLAPYLAFAPVFAAFLALPFGPDLTFEPRLNVGVFWILAILSVEVMGVILAGWASNNKWSVYGAMREACQMGQLRDPAGHLDHRRRDGGGHAQPGRSSATCRAAGFTPG